jgi:hypothetical protein
LVSIVESAVDDPVFCQHALSYRPAGSTGQIDSSFACRSSQHARLDLSFWFCFGQRPWWRRRGKGDFELAKHLSGSEDELRNVTRQYALDRIRQFLIVIGGRRASVAPDAPQLTDAVVTSEPERCHRCSIDRRYHRPGLGIWRLQRQHIPKRIVRLDDARGQQLECRISGRLYQQNGGSFPTITLQSTLTRAVPDSPLATTALNTILEFDYALNKDETKGGLAGVQYTRIAVDSSLATINPNIIGYVGAYYQWDNNWKFTSRAGVQPFGGAQILNLTPFQAFTQPILRFDLDRMDDNDNRLFGVTAQISWTPKPAYQLTVRTPIYFVRN